MFASLFVVILGLCYCSKESSQFILGRPRLFGPSEALVGEVLDLHCELEIYPKNESILLQLFKEGVRDKLFGEYSSLNGVVANFPLVIKQSLEGNLECVAKGQNNSNMEPTVSYTHYLRVVEPVVGAAVIVDSGPVEFFEGKTLKLSCKLKAGNYVSYKWLLNDKLLPQSPLHYAADQHLSIYRTTPKDSGSYMCVATNHFNKTVFTSNSSGVSITVKDVVSNPDLSFTVSKEGSNEYFAMVTCQSTRGTLPVTFSLYNRTEVIANATVEARKATFKVPLVLGQHLGRLQCQANNGDRIGYSGLIPLEVGRSSAGTYHCEVSDSYDNTTAISSKRKYLDKEVLNRIPVLVVAVVFGCFTFLVFLISVCCWTGVLFRRRRYGEKSLLSLEMDRMTPAYEDELELSEYNEDADVVKTARGGEFDQESSDASLD